MNQELGGDVEAEGVEVEAGCGLSKLNLGFLGV